MAAGLAILLAQDPALGPVADAVSEVPLRLRKPGLSGLVEIIIAQMVSKASASALTKRFYEHFPVVSASELAAATDETYRLCGLSGPKIRSIRALAAAIDEGTLNLETLSLFSAEEALAALTRIKGIGPWTGEVYLMFCEGHPDIFPAGDLALRIAVEAALQLPERPTDRELREIAMRWSPHRSVAARLFWAYYQTLKQGRDVIPL